MPKNHTGKLQRKCKKMTPNHFKITENAQNIKQMSRKTTDH